ncbi:MAG TPA: pyruvate kinase [Alphaproteobacteria bacterium]|nr:pyruvate kinase [Alphaproteobacteria bacterium]
MPQNTNTKILATIGPSTGSKEVLSKLIDAGADAFRFNFSHGTHEEHENRFKIVRELSKKKKRYISVVADMQGPKLRVGRFENGSVFLKAKQNFTLDLDETLGNEKRVNLPHIEIFKAVKKGDKLLLNDGNIILEVTKKDDSHIFTTVIVGGKLSDHKGVNLPNITLPISALTKKDIDDLKFALKLGVDWVSLSFVQKAQDVKDARKIIGKKALIISKLEKPSAMEELDEIIALSDAIMVARGDLGVECPIETVPVMQKRIIGACRKQAKPVIVATQMLESMINAPTPTRAEVSDVATAVYDMADTVMLSAETAVGSYPVEAVEMMHHIIERVESDSNFIAQTYHNEAHTCSLESLGITYAAKELSEVLPNVAAIVTFTNSGFTTFSMSKERPDLPIVAITPHENVASRMGIVWGVRAVVDKEVFKNFDMIEDIANKCVKSLGYGKKGDYIITTAGYPFGQTLLTNLLHTIKIK